MRTGAKIPLIALLHLLTLSCGGGQVKTWKETDSLSPTTQAGSPSDEPENVPYGGSESTNLTYYNFAAALMARECTSCHGVPPVPGSPATFRLDSFDDAEGIRGLKSLAERVRVRMEARTMPPPGTGRVTDDEIRQVAEWVHAGAPLGSPSAQTSPSPSPSPSVPSTGGTPNASDLTYYNFAQGALGKYCNACHAVPAAGGAPATFRLDSYADRDLIPGAYAMRLRIKARVADGTMPPPGDPPMTPEDLAQMIAWVDAGAPAGTPLAGQLNPSVSILQPPATGTTANQSTTVEVIFSESSAGATWSAFYSTTPGATTGGTPIAQALSTAQTTLTWNTTDLPANDYTVYVVLNDPTRTLTVAAAGTVTVAHPQPGNTTPQVQVVSPNGGTVVIRNTVLNISWTAADSDSGDLAAMSYTIDYSGDDGVTWRNIGTRTGTTSLSWTVPAAEPLTLLGRIRVKANDGKGGIAVDQSDTSFEIGEAGLTNPTYADFDVIAVSTCSGGGCHSSGQRDYTNAQANVTRDKSLIIDRILRTPGSAGYMPKGSTLTNSEKQTMLNYLNSL